MTKLIRAHVEGPGFYEEEYFHLPPDWETWTEEQRDRYCVETATTMQNNIAPCGGRVVEVDDAQLARLERDRLITD